jgi:hypothetical protein
MKKIYLMLAFAMIAGFTFAQCTIDTAAQTTPGISPAPQQMPCIVRTVPYNETIQVKNFSTIDTTVAGYTLHIQVDSMRLDSVAGLPSGITWARTPEILLGGANGCLTFSGTSTDSAKRYPLTWIGTVWMKVTSSIINFDTAYHGNLSRFQFTYFLDVMNSGDSCHYYPVSTGINNFSSDLNSAIYVYPNPNNGVFEFKMDAAKRVNGEVMVMDMAGRIVYNQKLDVLGMYSTSIDLRQFAKGLYTLQVRTADGYASKKISVE